jgi:hypothetical protein
MSIKLKRNYWINGKLKDSGYVSRFGLFEGGKQAYAMNPSNKLKR